MYFRVSVMRMVRFRSDTLHIIPLAGILRDRGLTEMLLLGSLDKELSQMILSRAQWLSEHYVCLKSRYFLNS